MNSLFDYPFGHFSFEFPSIFPPKHLQSHTQIVGNTTNSDQHDPHKFPEKVAEQSTNRVKCSIVVAVVVVVVVVVVAVVIVVVVAIVVVLLLNEIWIFKKPVPPPWL